MTTGRLAKHTAIYFVGNMANRIGAFVLLPLYTHYLTVEEYGALELIYSINAVVSVILGAGLSHATLRFFFDYEDVNSRNRVIITNLVVVGIIALIGTAILYYFSVEIVLAVFDTDKYLIAVQCALLIILLELISEIYYAYLRALEKSILYVGVSLLRLLVQIIASIYLVKYLSMGVTGVLVANLICTLVVASILTAYTIRKCGTALDPAIIKPLFRYSLPFALSSILAIVMTNADRFILNEYASISDVGIYALAFKFALLLTFIVIEPFQRSYGAYRFSILKQSNANQIYADVPEYMTVVASFVGLGIALFVSDVLYIMSDQQFLPAAELVPFLILGAIIQANHYCFQTGIMIKKKVRFVLYINIITAALSLGLNFILISTFHIYGAVITYIVANLVMTGLTLYYSNTLHPISYNLSRIIYPIILFLIIYSFFYLLPDDRLLAFLLKMPLVLLFVVIIFFTNKKLKSQAIFYFRKNHKNTGS